MARCCAGTEYPRPVSDHDAVFPNPLFGGFGGESPKYSLQTKCHRPDVADYSNFDGYLALLLHRRERSESAPVCHHVRLLRFGGSPIAVAQHRCSVKNLWKVGAANGCMAVIVLALRYQLVGYPLNHTVELVMVSAAGAVAYTLSLLALGMRLSVGRGRFEIIDQA